MNFRIFGRVLFIPIPAIAFLLLIIVLICAYTGYRILKKSNDDIIYIADDEAKVTSRGDLKETKVSPKVEPSPSLDSDEFIHIYVVGCVNKPGMVKIKKGQMVQDAIELAGGLKKNADAENINMAYILNENSMLKVLAKGEEEGRGIEIIYGATKEDDVTPSSNSGNKDNKESGQKKLININTATSEELQTLKGIGEAMAWDIIQYREANGPFSSIEEIMNVRGIKTVRFNAIKDYICV